MKVIEFFEQYGDEVVFFHRYANYTFSFVGFVGDLEPHQITVVLTFNEDDIGAFHVTAGRGYNVNGLFNLEIPRSTLVALQDENGEELFTYSERKKSA